MDISTTEQALRQAATTALRAPSIFNSQPWLWHVDEHGGTPRLRLRVAASRQLAVADPDGRLMILSCGVALHHAQLALAAAGHKATVTVLPDPDDSDLLADITLGFSQTPSQDEIDLAEAIERRHTDRRPFTIQPVTDQLCRELVTAAETQGAHLHIVPADHIGTLALAAVQAGALQIGDPAQRIELANWTHRPPWSGEGVPTETTVDAVPRRVPVRDFAPFGGEVSAAGTEWDGGAVYAVVFTDEDAPAAWLAAGQALSAVLLSATAHGLASATISDVTEVIVTREQLRRHLLSGSGHPQVAVRVGHPPQGTPPPPAPRKHPGDVIT
jgi:nitroreductase